MIRMLIPTVTVLSLLLVPSLANCQDDERSLASIHEEMIKALQESARILAMINSQEKAEESLEDLEMVDARIAALQTEARKLPRPSPEVTNALRKRFDKLLKRVIDRLDGEVKRIKEIEGAFPVVEWIEVLKFVEVNKKSNLMKCKSKLKQIGYALLLHLDKTKRFPPPGESSFSENPARRGVPRGSRKLSLSRNGRGTQ